MGIDPAATLPEVAAALRSGAATPADLVHAAYERLRARDAALGCFRWLLTEDEARRRAEALPQNITSSLWGVPGALKANLCRRGWPVDCASPMLHGWTPPYDACVVEKLDAVGALLLGLTNMDEFAMGSSTEHVQDLTTCNPHDPDRVAGGSSGGAAAAVAAGLVYFALGSDTGGSVRQPAHCCGIVGLKPTWGRISRRGLVPHACSLDQIGPLTRNVADCAAVYAAIAGHDPADATTLTQAVGDPLAAVRAEPRGMRIGVSQAAWDSVGEEQRRGYREARSVLEGAGVVFTDVDLPDPDRALAAYAVLASAEASANLARYDGTHIGRRRAGTDHGRMARRTRNAGFGQEVKLRILTGVYVLTEGLGADLYQRALAARATQGTELDQLLIRCDALLTPTMDGEAFRRGEQLDDSAAMLACDRWTVPASLSGLPSLVVPVGRAASGLPLSVQLMGRPRGEDTLLTVGAALERGLALDLRPEAAP